MTQQDDMVEKELHTDSFYLQSYEKYSPEDIYGICKALIKKAEDKGLKDCYLTFKSNFKPYEDYLGLPSIIPCGYRGLTKKEKSECDEQEVISKYAVKHDITFYEASTLYKIRYKLGLDFS